MNKVSAIGYLIPKTSFEYLFFILPLVLFLIGYSYRSKLGILWEQKFKNIGLKSRVLGIISSQEIIEATTPSQQKFIYSLPGMFLIIGLLGTFWGLGLGMVKMDAAINSSGEDMMYNLKSSLADLSVQFKSSIWGILFNLLTKVFFGNIPQMHHAYILLKLDKLADEKERLENAHKAGLLEKLSNNNAHLQEVITNGSLSVQQIKELNSKYQSTVDAINNFKEENSEITLKLKIAAEEFTEGAKSMNTSIESYKDEMSIAFGKIGRIISDIKGFIEASRSAIDTSVQALKDEIKLSLSDFSTSISGTLGQVSQSLMIATGSIERAIEDSMKMVGETSKTSSESIEIATSSLKDQVGTLSSELSRNLAEVTRILNASQKQMDSQTRIHAEVASWLGGLNESTNRYYDDLEKLRTIITTMSNEKANLIGNMASLLGATGIVSTRLGEMVEEQKNLNRILSDKKDNE